MSTAVSGERDAQRASAPAAHGEHAEQTSLSALDPRQLSVPYGYLRFKRAFDIVNALLQLTFFAPLMLLISAVIWLSDRGPVFFLQDRLTGGRRGPRVFKIIKFRTMVVDAERLGAKITGKNDCRVTPIGRLLRKTKLDELPQYINVLKGEMSFVGPRPQTLGYVEAFKDHYYAIHSIVPAGVTDLASVKYKDEGRILDSVENPEQYYVEHIMPDKIRCHYEYVSHMGLAADLKIIFLTLARVFSRSTQSQEGNLSRAEG